MVVLIKLNEMYNEYEGREVGNKLTVMRYKITKLGMNSRGFVGRGELWVCKKEIGKYKKQTMQ